MFVVFSVHKPRAQIPCMRLSRGGYT